MSQLPQRQYNVETRDYQSVVATSGKSDLIFFLRRPNEYERKEKNDNLAVVFTPNICVLCLR